MKIVNHKTLTSALFALCALMFAVAVSGGCGGGSSNSVSQDTITIPEGFTTEYATPGSMLSAPDGTSEPVLSSDEYGNGNYSVFDLLTKTTWRIGSMTILDSNGNVVVVSDVAGKNYNTDTVTFLTSDKTMYWAKSDAKKTPLVNDLTAQFFDEVGNMQTAPILRAGIFTETTKNKIYQANIAANSQSKIGRGTEIIELPEASLTPTRLSVKNQFTAGNSDTYQCVLDLERVDKFLILDQTNWKVKDMQVIGMVQDTDGQYIAGDPQNYVITDNDYLNKTITLKTSVINNKRFFEYNINYPLLSFIDKTLDQKFFAPYLRTGSGFEPQKDKQGPFELFRAVLKNDSIPGDEILYVTDYGPNAEIVIDNSFFYREQNNVIHHYWIRAKLTPAP